MERADPSFYVGLAWLQRAGSKKGNGNHGSSRRELEKLDERKSGSKCVLHV